MYNLKIVIEQGGDAALSKFSAALFFSIVRATGADPFVSKRGVYCGTVISQAYTDACKWAAIHDPVGELRRRYARGIWEARPPDTDTVELG